MEQNLLHVVYVGGGVCQGPRPSEIVSEKPSRVMLGIGRDSL